MRHSGSFSAMWHRGPLVAVAILALAGCGSAGKGSNSTGGAPKAAAGASTTADVAGGRDSARLISAADAICKRVNDELLGTRAGGVSPQEIIRDVPAHEALERKGLLELEALKAPSSIRVQWKQILGYRGKLARELATLVDDARRNDTAAIKQLEGAKKHNHELLLASAKSSGFKVCGTLG